ncbi:hypothetical protein KUTeg_000342 [Tegillarca granosa]|uniref:Uncharacterized protein n=1 Tax=Tegillarca granosa TaxID=220873 RepID=A0ABQ9FYM9_TEGGR|nr:hypothetical protein KUTeg_000342 [Tegillarca granosa]
MTNLLDWTTHSLPKAGHETIKEFFVHLLPTHEKQEPVRLNLLTCQVKLVPDDIGKKCFDLVCANPEWLSTNLGVVICLECCGIHRNLGVHISRTQSLVIDELGTSQLLLARVVGNTFFNDIMEAKLDPSMKLNPSSPMNEREQFIKAKYEQHKFAIITCTDHEDLKQDLKQAIVTRDLSALFQVYAEGIDLMSVLPDMLMAAINGKKDVFQHVNIDWNLSGTPDRKCRSRPPSLVTGAVTGDSPTGTPKDLPFDLRDMRDRSDSTKSLPLATAQFGKQRKLLNPNKQRQRSLQNYVPNHSAIHQSVIYTNTSNGNTTVTRQIQSHDQGPSNELKGPGPPLPPRGKRPPPPPPPGGHTRNKSEPFFPQVEHRRTTSDPPPRPAPPEFRNTIIGNIGAKQVLPPLPVEPGGNILPSDIIRRDRSQSASEESRLSASKDMPPPPIVARVKKKPPIGQHCKALFDCEADNEDELTFREGEVIVILREEEDDWWEGEILGQPSRKGVFPKTFVTLLSE